MNGREVWCPSCFRYVGYTRLREVVCPHCGHQWEPKVIAKERSVEMREFLESWTWVMAVLGLLALIAVLGIVR